MAYLHEDREEFTNAINLASEYFRVLPIVAEKDYYVAIEAVKKIAASGMFAKKFRLFSPFLHWTSRSAYAIIT